MRKYRFFYHYRRSIGGMSVHFKNVCYPCINVKCNVPVETKYNKTQPRLVMQGFCTYLNIDQINETITIN